MRYQEVFIAGMPEWVKFGVQVKAWNYDDDQVRLYGTLIGYNPGAKFPYFVRLLNGSVATYTDAEPIAVLEPKIGERVIGWDDEDATIILGTFIEAYVSHQHKIVSRKERSYLCGHIARIHPGLHFSMSIDEIKANTDWI